MLYKILAAAVSVVAILIGVRLVFHVEPVLPPNHRVTEYVYGMLEEGMTEDDVGRLLGEPHKVKGGLVVRVDDPVRASFKFVIQDRRRTSGGDFVNIYSGPREESIRVLFSGDRKKVAAAEYRVADEPVLYHGRRSEQGTPAFSGAMERAVLSPEMENRRKALEHYIRKKELTGGGPEDLTAPPPGAIVSTGDRPPTPAGDPPPGAEPAADGMADNSSEARELRTRAEECLAQAREAYADNRYPDCVAACDDLLTTSADGLTPDEQQKLNLLRQRAEFRAENEEVNARLKDAADREERAELIREFLDKHAARDDLTEFERSVVQKYQGQVKASP